MRSMIIARNIFRIKNKSEEISKRSIKKERLPNNAPRKSLIFEIFLFKTMERAKRRIKSYKKLIRKT